MKFIIYFDQVNQQKYDIEAKSEEEAIKKARRSWMATFRDPDPSYITYIEEKKETPK